MIPLSLRKIEERYLLNVFQKNGYPRNFIKRHIPPSQPIKPKAPKESTKKIALPYIKDISEITARLFKPLGIDVVHKPTKSLHSILCQPKDSTAKEEKTNIIYKINCNNCEKHYIGQSGRPLRLRIHENKLAVK
uniref:GIY-YIG domain-containing protein n=1 Tax=Trichobilharzia regenti TaxID=157069 RepID=A0AA85KBS6_TRIRE|nr:unnamed protein product [Trichobilharzia regenti]